jgi:protein-S-isoprenylcysteine O-methyltransferase Ste14
MLMIVTGAVVMLTVLNLAVGGLGAPFAVALSKRLAVQWMYAWTRNPMVLSTIAFLLAVGLWLQSTLFVLWMIVLVAPAWLFLLKVFEERELLAPPTWSTKPRHRCCGREGLRKLFEILWVGDKPTAGA